MFAWATFADRQPPASDKSRIMFEGALSLVAYVKIFVAMIVIVNPFGIMPVFVAMTASQSEKHRMRIARIAAQTGCQSGLAVVYSELLNFHGNEVWFKEVPGLVGMTFGQALLAYEDRLARSLATIINVIDPDVIVLGGGLSNVPRWYSTVPKIWTKYVMSDHVVTRLVPPKYGDASGARGAAWLWNDKHISYNWKPQ